MTTSAAPAATPRRYSGVIMRGGRRYDLATLDLDSLDFVPDMLTFALRYRRAGWSIIPCCTPLADYGCKRCAVEGGDKAGKHPLIRWAEYQQAAASLDRVISWWQRWPDANIAIITGAVSGNLYVIDVDSQSGGDYGGLGYLYGDEVYSNVQAVAGGGGRHLYFRWPAGLDLKLVTNTTSALAPAIDTRGEGGYIIAPPSLHRTGRRYSWLTLDGTDIPIAAPATNNPRPLLPSTVIDKLQAIKQPVEATAAAAQLPADVAALLDRLDAAKRAVSGGRGTAGAAASRPASGLAWGKGAINGATDEVAHAAPHTAHMTLYYKAVHLARAASVAGLDVYDIQRGLAAAAAARGIPAVEASATIEDGLSWGLANQRISLPAPPARAMASTAAPARRAALDVIRRPANTVEVEGVQHDR